MSNKRVDQDRLKSFLECSICLEQYVDPKMLACTHEYCKHCIEQLLQFHEDGSALITCPMRCEETTKLDQNQTVSNLPASYNFKNILEMMGEGDNQTLSKKMSTCSYTKKCKKKPVSVYCCGKLMCNTCKDKHRSNGCSNINNKRVTSSSSSKNTKNNNADSNNEKKLIQQTVPIGFNRSENKLMILCDIHNTFCRSICVDDRFLCMYCDHRDNTHKQHKKTLIESEVEILQKLISCELSYRKWVLKLKEITQRNIDLVRGKLSNDLKRKKQECLKAYTELLDNEEATLLKRFEMESDQHMTENFDVASTKFCENFLQKEGIEYILQKEDIFREVSKTGTDCYFSNLKMTYNDAVPFLDIEPLGKINFNSEDLRKKIELQPTFQYKLAKDMKTDTADAQSESSNLDKEFLEPGYEPFPIHTDLNVSVALKVRGNALYKEQRYMEARNFYSKAIDFCPANADELAIFFQNRGAAQEGMENMEESREDCTEALKINPRYVKALQRRSRMHKSLCDMKEAFDDAVAAKYFDVPENKKKHDFSSIPYNYDFLPRLERKYAEQDREILPTVPSFIRLYLADFGSLDMLSSSLSSNSDEDVVYSTIVGDLKNEQYFNVEARCSDLIKMDGKYKHLALLLRGSFRFCRNDFDSALQDFDLLITELKLTCSEHTALRVDAHLKRALLKKTTGDENGSKLDFEEAKRLNCDNPSIYHNSAECDFLNEGEPCEVIADYHRAISLDADFIPSHIQLGEYLFIAAKDYEDSSYMEQADETFKETVRLFPKDAEVLRRYGQFLFKTARIEESLQEIEKSISLAPWRPQAYVDKGNVLLQKGKLMLAHQLTVKSLEMDAYCHEAHCLRGKILLTEGKYDEALTSFNKSLGLLPSSQAVLIDTLAHMEECEIMMKLHNEYYG